jgi:hypothetical protein
MLVSAASILKTRRTGRSSLKLPNTVIILRTAFHARSHTSFVTDHQAHVAHGDYLRCTSMKRGRASSNGCNQKFFSSWNAVLRWPLHNSLIALMTKQGD